MKKMFFILSIVFCSFIRASELEITADNLCSLTSPIPEEICTVVDSWFDTNEGAWQALVEQPGRSIDARERFLNGLKFLIQKGIRFRSPRIIPNGGQSIILGANYIFSLPALSTYFLKISGAMNRACAQAGNQDLPYGKFDSIDETKLVPTYQTASRVVAQLKIAEKISRDRINAIGVVDTYLYCRENRCEDESCIVLQKKLPDHYNSLLVYKNRLERILTKSRIHELLTVATYACQWDLTLDNIFFSNDDEKFCLIDTEQPNATILRDVFDADMRRKNYLACCACMSLWESVKEHPRLCSYIKNFVARRDDIQDAYNFDELKAKF